MKKFIYPLPCLLITFLIHTMHLERPNNKKLNSFVIQSHPIQRESGNKQPQTTLRPLLMIANLNRYINNNNFVDLIPFITDPYISKLLIQNGSKKAECLCAIKSNNIVTFPQKVTPNFAASMIMVADHASNHDFLIKNQEPLKNNISHHPLRNDLEIIVNGNIFLLTRLKENIKKAIAQKDVKTILENLYSVDTTNLTYSKRGLLLYNHYNNAYHIANVFTGLAKSIVCNAGISECDLYTILLDAATLGINKDFLKSFQKNENVRTIWNNFYSQNQARVDYILSEATSQIPSTPYKHPYAAFFWYHTYMNNKQDEAAQQILALGYKNYIEVMHN